MLRRISVRQATAYLLYLVTNASLFNLTKVEDPNGCDHSGSPASMIIFQKCDGRIFAIPSVSICCSVTKQQLNARLGGSCGRCALCIPAESTPIAA